MNKVQAMIEALGLVGNAFDNWNDGGEALEESYGEKDAEDVLEAVSKLLQELALRQQALEQASGRKFKGGKYG